jgi:hypothetical protein
MLTRTRISTPPASHRLAECLRTSTPHLHLSSLPRVPDIAVRISLHDLAYIAMAADLGLALLNAETAAEVHEVHRRVSVFKACPNGTLFPTQTSFILTTIDASMFSRL